MNRHATRLLLASLLCTLGGPGLAVAADGSQPGLRLRAGNPFGGGSALVDMQLPRPDFLRHSLFSPWWSTASVSETRLVPSWRSLGGAAALPSTGLRLSGGVVGISRHTAYGPSPAGDRAVVDLSMNTQPGAWTQGLSVSVPYLGIGYSGMASDPHSLGKGWGFSADIGLMTLAPTSSSRLDRVFSNPQTLDDALRDLRLTPLMQLGVSYSF